MFVNAVTGICENIDIEGNIVNDCKDNGIRFQPEDLLQFGNIRKCTVRGNKITNISIDGIRLNGNKMNASENVIDSCNGYGIKSEGGDNNLISKNIVHNTLVGIGLYVEDANTKNVLIDNNQVEYSNGATGGIVITRVAPSLTILDVNVTNNISNDNAGNGIAIDNTDFLTVSNNKCNLNNKSGISLVACKNVSFVGNSVKNNSQNPTGGTGISFTGVTRCNVSANQSIDDQTTKTQGWGMRLFSPSNYVNTINNTFFGNANAAGYYDGSGGANNTTANNITG